MARYKFIAQCNALDGRDDEFNAWYDKQHLPDMLKIPGFISAERFTRVGEGPFSYLAIYEIETDDLDAALAEIGTRSGTKLMPISDSVDGTGAQMVAWQLYSPSRERIG